MSKERELLKRIANYGDTISPHFIYEINELLAQPEQQPEAWIIVNKETGYRTQVSDLTPFLYHREIFEVIPLYTAPPKREPLTPQQISEGNQSTLNVTREAFKQGVIFAEKAHGIGGGE